jgi:hypothetical protein
MGFESSSQAMEQNPQQRRAHGAAYVPWVPLVLGVVACVTAGIW